ncbi:MAG: GNAT family N-acetyltransferase [Phycisphaeraceae bacterium]|nr:GNAT family N-acetyltransferase [Phycisphaeraceae bacterium]
MSQIRLKEPDGHDVRLLSELGAQTFIHAYASTLEPAQLAAYVAQAFSEARIAQELKDPGIYYLLALDQGQACAYAKLVPSDLPEVLSLIQAIELKRLYVIPEYWGQGVGTRLMETLLDWAFAHGHPNMWLRVWQKNVQAMSFYQRWRFRPVGQEPYHVGDCSEIVQLMVRP